MTFDLTPEQQAWLTAVRPVSEAVASRAADIDAQGSVPADVASALASLDVWSQAPADAVLAIEQVSTASASAGAHLALGATSGEGLSGLRGVAPVAVPSSRQQLGLAAVCVGIGRAALDAALSAVRARGDRPSGEPADPPHWALADAATEIEAARLLVLSAAQRSGISEPGALAFAGGAASRAVEAAVRVMGPDAYRPGSIVERCGRDANAARLILGTEDQARRQAADALLQ